MDRIEIMNCEQRFDEIKDLALKLYAEFEDDDGSTCIKNAVSFYEAWDEYRSKFTKPEAVHFHELFQQDQDYGNIK